MLVSVQFGRGETLIRGGDGGPALAAALYAPSKIAFDSEGDLFVYEDPGDAVPAIRKISAKSETVFTVWAGCPRSQGARDQTHCPGLISSMKATRTGRLLLADRTRSRIWSFDPKDGGLTTIAGNGDPKFSGDGGPAVSAGIRDPVDVVEDGLGNIFVVDQTDRVRRIDARTGIISTVAGSGAFGSAGDGGSALSAQFTFILGIAVDSSGNLYIADQTNRIRKEQAEGGIITTIAGTGRTGRFAFPLRPGSALQADLFYPSHLIVDNDQSIVFLNSDTQVCKLALRSGIVTVLAGLGREGYDGDGALATRAHIFASDLAIDPGGNLFFVDSEHDRIRRVDAATGIVTTFAGNGHRK